MANQFQKEYLPFPDDNRGYQMGVIQKFYDDQVKSGKRNYRNMNENFLQNFKYLNDDAVAGGGQPYNLQDYMDIPLNDKGLMNPPPVAQSRYEQVQAAPAEAPRQMRGGNLKNQYVAPESAGAVFAKPIR